MLPPSLGLEVLRDARTYSRHYSGAEVNVGTPVRLPDFSNSSWALGVAADDTVAADAVDTGAAAAAVDAATDGAPPTGRAPTADAHAAAGGAAAPSPAPCAAGATPTPAQAAVVAGTSRAPRRFEALEGGVVVLFEAIERFAIPDSIARIAATRRSCSSDSTTGRRRYAPAHGRGPIGMGEALFKEAWRARARELGSEDHRPRAPLLWADGRRPAARSGGEGVATALQLYCDSPKRTSRGRRSAASAPRGARGISSSLADAIG